MKKLLTISLLIFSLNAANFTNNGATITIGQGVTLRADGDFENNGYIINNNYGTFAISGQFTGDSFGYNWTYFGDATVVTNGYSHLKIEGNNSLEANASIMVSNLTVSGNLFLPENTNIDISSNFARNGGSVSGQGYLANASTEYNECLGEINPASLGFVVNCFDSSGVVDISTHRFPEMVYYHDRVSLNSYFLTNLIVEHGNQNNIGIGIVVPEQDLNGMDVDKLSIFTAEIGNLDTWTDLGGTIIYENSSNPIIMLDSIPEHFWLEGNPNLFFNRYFTVGQRGCVDNLAANYDPMAFGGEYECTYDFTKELNQGVNLMSFYSMDDDDNSVGNILSSLDQATDIIGEGIASNLHPILGWIGSATEVERERGYWVRVYSDDEYEHLSGSPNRTDMSYDLNAGANLISYSGPSLTPIGDAMPEGSSCYSVVGQGVATTYNEVLGWIGSLTDLEPWGGYWVKCTEPEMLHWQGHGALPRLDIETYSVPEEFAFEQSTQQAFYFIEQIEDAMIGRDIIIAKKGDDIVGSVVYSGDYTTVPVMGNWEDIPGYSPNEIVTLQLYNPDVDAYYYLEGQELQAFENLGINMVGPMTQLPVIPENFVLHNAYPNPFNPSTNIRFDLPNQVKVTLEVYNVNGQLVKTLKDSNMEPGYYEVNWDASSVASGAYFVKLSAGSRVGTQKIMLIK